MQNYLIKPSTFVVITLVAIAVAVGVVWSQRAYGSEFPRQSVSPKAHASSTATALGWGVNTRVVSTSTREEAAGGIPATVGRASITFQTTHCAAGGAVFLQFNDIPAATTTGYLLTASSTVTLGQDIPMYNGSIRALSYNGACTLLTTENRSEN